MRKSSLLSVVLLAVLSSSLAAHDLFLKLADYLVSPGAEVRITALNGTFTTSENTIVRSRVANLTLAGPAGRESLDTTRVSALGTRTLIRARTGPPGTYVLGLSIHPSRLSLTGAEFNAYLKEEGLGQVLEARRGAGELAKAATEQYAKHVKVLFQAGPNRSDSYGTVLGYPVEIVPLQNPYALRPGDTLSVRLLVDGSPAPGLEALAGGRNTAGARISARTIRAGADGVAGLALSSAGTWYIKFISMTRATEPGIDYVSHWATLTFAVAATRSSP